MPGTSARWRRPPACSPSGPPRQPTGASDGAEPGGLRKHTLLYLSRHMRISYARLFSWPVGVSAPGTFVERNAGIAGAGTRPLRLRERLARPDGFSFPPGLQKRDVRPAERHFQDASATSREALIYARRPAAHFYYGPNISCEPNYTLNIKLRRARRRGRSLYAHS